MCAAFGHAGQQRTTDAAQFPFVAQPFGKRERFAVACDEGIAVQLGRGEHRIDQRVGIAMADAQRIAGFVGQAAALQRQFEVAHVLVDGAVLAEADIAEFAPGDALVGQHFGHERLVL